jgi:hypothetical protein
LARCSKAHQLKRVHFIKCTYFFGVLVQKLPKKEGEGRVKSGLVICNASDEEEKGPE